MFLSQLANDLWPRRATEHSQAGSAAGRRRCPAWRASARKVAQFGVRITAVTPGTEVVAQADSPSIVPPASLHVLTQQGSTKPVSFTLSLARPVTRASFTRPKLLALTASGVTHPVWKATAFDVRGKMTDSVGEALISRFEAVPAATFELKGPDITSIRIDSDCKAFAGFAGVLLGDIVLERAFTPKR